MFWQSVSEGLKSVLDWHVLAGIVGVGVASLLPLVAGMNAATSNPKARSGAGCLILGFGGMFIQAAAVSGFVLICLPAMLGTGGFTPWGLIGPLLWPVAKAGALAALLVLLLTLIPIAGDLIANTPGVAVFLQGMFMAKAAIREFYSFGMDTERPPESAFPTFWNCIGYVLIGTALCWGALMIVALIADQIEKRKNPTAYRLEQARAQPSALQVLVGTFAGPLFGIVPLLMYCAYVSIAIRLGP